MDRRSRFLNYLGGACYRLNGGLIKLNNESWLDRLSLWFWSVSYSFGDEQCRAMLPLWVRWLR